jgi:glycine cleavage system pyridoxal-binding protein P
MTRTSLTQLEARDAFIARHIGPDAAEQQQMLDVLGYASRAALIDAIVPPGIRNKNELPLGQFFQPLPENEALAKLKGIASKNKVLKSLIGQGYYNAHTPGVILRNIFENPAWYTAYTPYQPEISQGRLEAILNFQQVLIDLTGMAIANSSMLDEGTAAAEAMTLIQRVGKSKSNTFYVANDVLPQTLEVVQTRAEPLGITVKTFDPSELAGVTDAFGVLLQYPGVNGVVRDYRAAVEAVKANGTMVIVAADLLALTMLTPPGEWGADVVVGNSQRFGVPLGFGGPHAGYMATRDEYKRSMPGRLVGVTVDQNGNKAYRLALQTREQHIRREKATSNICTAQVLLAVMASMYAVYHGPQGLKQIAERTHRYTGILAANLKSLGYSVNESFFDTLTVATDKANELHAAAVAAGINLRKIDAKHVGVSLDETCDRDTLAALWNVFSGGKAAPDFDAVEAGVDRNFPEALVRTSAYLEHPTFNRYHSETEMLRYLRSLADKDLALDRTMIPLGSCTMKLNATSEMIPVTWPEFSTIHPFAPADQTVGYREMIAQLEEMLCAVTGYAAVSLQPNAGSQGEYAGLLVIKKYHESRGEGHRARHQPCFRRDGGHAGRGNRLRRQGQCGPGRPESQGRTALEEPGLRDGDLSIHPRRVRRRHHRTVRHHPQARRPGVRGRRQHERPGWRGRPRLLRRRRIAPEPAQDLLHPARRRRPRRRPDRRWRTPGQVPAEPALQRLRAQRRRHRLHLGRTVRLRIDPADLLDVHRHDGRRRLDRRHRNRDPERQLRGASPVVALPCAVLRPRRPGRARMHHRPASADRCHRHQQRRRGQAPDGLRLPRTDHELPGTGHADDRADRIGIESRTGPLH